MKKLVLDAYCKLPESFIKSNNILLIDIPYFIDNRVYHYHDYHNSDYLDVNQCEFCIDEANIDSFTIENMLQESLVNNDELLYICTVDNKSINFDKINEIIRLFKDKYTFQFEVIYLPSNNLATRFIVEKAIEFINSKNKLITIRKDIEKLSNEYCSYILLEDKNIITKHLPGHSMSLMFGSKPIFNLKMDNSLELIAKEDGLTNGINRLLDIIGQVNKGEKILLSYAKSAKHAKLLEHLINKQFSETIKVEKQFLEPMLINQFGLGALIISIKEVK